MDFFKLSVSDKHFYQLTQECFEEKTLTASPWYQTNIEGETPFAICPSCSHATQIIGFTHTPNEGIPVYGRYYLRKEISKRNIKSNIGLQIKSLLIKEFDRVISLLNNQIPVHLNYHTIKDMLKYYKQEKGWLYRGATLDNIPWTFAYMTQSYHLYGQIIQDALLRQKLKTLYPYIYFDDNHILRRKYGSKEFFDANFCFIHHKMKLGQHKLAESIVFVVGDSSQNTIYRKTIDFEHAYFCHLIAKEDQSDRNQNILDLCSSILLDNQGD